MPGTADPVAANSGRGAKASSRKGRAETPAPLSGATDAPEEKKVEAPADTVSAPAGAPVDQSTAPAGLQPTDGSTTNVSEQADDAAEASAAADITAAPAALPSGAAAGVTSDTREREASGSAGTDSPVHPGAGEAVTTAPAGEASADPAGASRAEAPIDHAPGFTVREDAKTAYEIASLKAEVARARDRALEEQLAALKAQVGFEDAEANIGAAGRWFIGVDQSKSDSQATVSVRHDGSHVASWAAQGLTEEQVNRLAPIVRAFNAVDRPLSWLAGGFAGACVMGVDHPVRLKVFPGDNLRRAGRQFAVGEAQTFAPTDLTPEQLLFLLNERRFHLEWIETE